MTDRREEWSDGGSWRTASSCWAFNEVERLPGLFPPAVAPAKPRYLALALCPAQATIPPNPLSEHINIKAKHLPSRSLQLFGNANVPPSGSLLHSLMLAKHQNVIKIDMDKQKIFYYRLLIKPTHSILQYLCFWINGKIYLITNGFNPCLNAILQTTGDLERVSFCENRLYPVVPGFLPVKTVGAFSSVWTRCSIASKSERKGALKKLSQHSLFPVIYLPVSLTSGWRAPPPEPWLSHQRANSQPRCWKSFVSLWDPNHTLTGGSVFSL